MEFAVFAEEVSFDWSIISDIKELEVIGGHLGFNTYGPAIDFLQRGLITSRGITSEPFACRISSTPSTYPRRPRAAPSKYSCVPTPSSPDGGLIGPPSAATAGVSAPALITIQGAALCNG
jgi:hypothetical protein